MDADHRRLPARTRCRGNVPPRRPGGGSARYRIQPRRRLAVSACRARTRTAETPTMRRRHVWRRCGASSWSLYGVQDDASRSRTSYLVRRDGTFAYQAWRWATLHAASQDAPVFLYYFAHPVPLPPARHFREAVPPAGYGAWHGAELWYAFDTLDTKPFPWQPGDHQACTNLSSSAFVAFARDGVPASDWPSFTAASHDAAIIEARLGRQATCRIAKHSTST